ncbi:unnamed protein product, partial [Polarella glacialis]
MLREEWLEAGAAGESCARAVMATAMYLSQKIAAAAMATSTATWLPVRLPRPLLAPGHNNVEEVTSQQSFRVAVCVVGQPRSMLGQRLQPMARQLFTALCPLQAPHASGRKVDPLALFFVLATQPELGLTEAAAGPLAEELAEALRQTHCPSPDANSKNNSKTAKTTVETPGIEESTQLAADLVHAELRDDAGPHEIRDVEQAYEDDAWWHREGDGRQKWVRQLQGFARCHELISKEEPIESAFDWVVVLRPDLLHVVPLPDLRAFGPGRGIILPDGGQELTPQAGYLEGVDKALILHGGLAQSVLAAPLQLLRDKSYVLRHPSCLQCEGWRAPGIKLGPEKHLANVLLELASTHPGLELFVDRDWIQPLVLSQAACVNFRACADGTCLRAAKGEAKSQGPRLPRWARHLVAQHSCWPAPKSAEGLSAMSEWVEIGGPKGESSIQGPAQLFLVLVNGDHARHLREIGTATCRRQCRRNGGRYVAHRRWVFGGRDLVSWYDTGDEKDGHKGKTVVVIIPFRDRDLHLTLFKKYWRWFARHGRENLTVQRWEVFVSEQFDSTPFNRGWVFNVAFAVASGQLNASPEVTGAAGIDFDCAAIQDIDYLPEKGVDYGECEVPIQLSSEIDRYDWKTPYLKFAGAVVSMSLTHWRQINGFANNYVGWGGEDDDLFQRLRLNNLLYGDCYPWCEDPGLLAFLFGGDPNIGKLGLSIKRPKMGSGRFSGKLMHGANHTKRITDGKAYDANVVQMKAMERGDSRWKTDGLSSLAFRIVDHAVDTTDREEFGITYHHIRAKQGKDPFDVRLVPMAIPPGFCAGKLGRAELKDLRLRAASWALAADVGTASGCPGAESATFLLIDRRRQLAKVFTDEDPRLLLIFLRSMQNPLLDGLIVADPRSKADLQRAFKNAHAFADPPTEYSVCTSISREAVTFCDNEKHGVQKVVYGASCPKEWANLEWVFGDTFYVPKHAPGGKVFCVGSRERYQEDMSFSRLLPTADCSGDGFRHEFNFGSVVDTPALASMVVCIGRDGSGRRSRVSTGKQCSQDGFMEKGHFAARRAAEASSSDTIFCVTSDGSSDVIQESAGGKCGGLRTDNMLQKISSRDITMTFAVPTVAPELAVSQAEPEELMTRTQ